MFVFAGLFLRSVSLLFVVSFKLLCENKRTFAVKRQRCKWDTLPLPGAIWPDIQNQLWIGRVHAFSAEDKRLAPDASKAACLSYLFATVLGLPTISRFNDYLKEKATLKNGTYARAYTSMITEVTRQAGGKHLSSLGGKDREKASEALRVLRDKYTEWNELAIPETNVRESARIVHALNAIEPKTRLGNLFYFIFIERFWFAARFEISVPASSRQQLLRATGFANTLCCIGRAVSRPELNAQLSMDQFKDYSGGAHTFCFPRHKTARSYGTLVAVFPEYVMTVLVVYINNVRAQMIARGLFQGSTDKLFPTNSVFLMKKFLQVVGLDSVTPSDIRTAMCQFIETIHEDSKWFSKKRNLQACAAHQVVRTQTVEQFYAVKMKHQREIEYQQFVRETLLHPAEKRIKKQLELLQRSVPPNESFEDSQDEKHDPTYRVSDSADLSPPELLASEGYVNPAHAYAKYPTELPASSGIRHKHILSPPESPNKLLLSTKTYKLTVPSLSKNMKEKLASRICSVFRKNYLCLPSVVSPICTKVLKQSWANDFDHEVPYRTNSDFYRQVLQRAVEFSKKKLRALRSTLPFELWLQQCETKEVKTVADLKEVMSPANVREQLHGHAAFKKHQVKASVISRLQADTEQKYVNLLNHQQLQETPGSSPDSKGHFAALRAWRKAGLFTIERFEPPTLTTGDENTALIQLYKVSKRKKKRRRPKKKHSKRTSKKSKQN
jgi:hypothetical protein